MQSLFKELKFNDIKLYKFIKLFKPLKYNKVSNERILLIFNKKSNHLLQIAYLY